MIYWYSSSKIKGFSYCGLESFFRRNVTWLNIESKTVVLTEEDTVFLLVDKNIFIDNMQMILNPAKIVVVLITKYNKSSFPIAELINDTDVFTYCYLVDNRDYKKRLNWVSKRPSYFIDAVVDNKFTNLPTKKFNDILNIYSKNHDFHFYGVENFYVNVDSILEKEYEHILKLSNYAFVIICDQDAYTDHLLLLAGLGVVVIDLTKNNSLKKCFPFFKNNYFNSNEIKSLISYLKANKDYYSYIVNYAVHAARQYTDENIYNRLSILSGIDVDPSVSNKDIIHVFGEKHINIHKDEFCVFCLQKNGSFFMKEWIEYYKNIGAKHFFIVDNESDDGTVEFLKVYSDITLFSTSLPFMYCESYIRNYVVSNYCHNMWCLSVDIDEFFDYPHSDRISMRSFLSYQNRHGYTAVVGNMLDMYSQKIPEKEVFFRKDYTSYDVSRVKKNNYAQYLDQFCLSNKINGNPFIAYAGGVREDWCNLGRQHEYLLIKHPLTFQDGQLQPHITPHFCDDANISDVSCVLYHYKFVPGYVNNIIKRVGYSNYFVSKEYHQYSDFYNDNPDFNLSTDNSKVWGGNNSIVDSKYFSISKEYTNYVNSFDK